MVCSGVPEDRLGASLCRRLGGHRSLLLSGKQAADWCCRRRPPALSDAGSFAAAHGSAVHRCGPTALAFICVARDRLDLAPFQGQARQPRGYSLGVVPAYRRSLKLKGIILAGGSGSRLYPPTLAVPRRNRPRARLSEPRSGPHPSRRARPDRLCPLSDLPRLAETVDWFIANEWWWRPIREGKYRGERLGSAA